MACSCFFDSRLVLFPVVRPFNTGLSVSLVHIIRRPGCGRAHFHQIFASNAEHLFGGICSQVRFHNRLARVLAIHIEETSSQETVHHLSTDQDYLFAQHIVHRSIPSHRDEAIQFAIFARCLLAFSISGLIHLARGANNDNDKFPKAKAARLSIYNNKALTGWLGHFVT
jgi:hypothetical protein